MTEYLIISKEEFLSKIKNQINEGLEIQNQKTLINSTEELERIKKRFRRWDSINSSIIKNSFNVRENEYFAEYEDCDDIYDFTTSTEFVDIKVIWV